MSLSRVAVYLQEAEKALVAPDPALRFYAGDGTLIGANDDWDASLAPRFGEVGGFPYLEGSKDSAGRLVIPKGLVTSQTFANGPGGIILVELYDNSL